MTTCMICGKPAPNPTDATNPLCDTCQERVDAYAERRQQRIERLTQRAEKKHEQAAATNQDARQMAQAIPFGQPILQGHHSEARDRRYRQRITDKFRRAYEQSKEAERLDARAAAAERNDTISSDDPAAVIKLRDKIATAEALQERMKAANRVIRNKKLTIAEQIAGLVEQGFTDAQARELITPDWCNRLGFAPYQLQNNSANIRRMKQRLAELQALVGRETTTEEAEGIPGLEVVRNAEANRLQLIFDAKPDKATRTILKSHGWRWAPSQGAWQRNLNAASETALEWTLEKLHE